jgi:outer membrane protein assembly factor BamB/tetratricopeptide (TPR) repeat protein
MPDPLAALAILVRLAPGPLRSEDAASALGLDVGAIEEAGQVLLDSGVLEFSNGGFVSGPNVDEAEISPIRRTRLAVALAEALEARQAFPADIGTLYATAARWEKAREPLASAALAPGADPERAARLAGLALEADDHVPGLDRPTRGRLRLTRARHLRASGRSHEAMEELEQAAHLLTGVERVDALGFATVVADDLQSPQWAETLAALAESEAWTAGEPAKAGSILTLRGRMLGRIGFPREADRVLEVGGELLERHGHEVQRFYARLNRVWVQLDRGEARSAETGFSRLRDEAVEIEGPISQADKHVYWARAAFATGHPVEALTAVALAEAVAIEHDAPVLAFLAAIARAEGALYFERYDEALEAAHRVLDFALRDLPAWENRARILRGRALIGLGDTAGAVTEADAALATTPHGVDGLRLRKEIQVLRLLALPLDVAWPKSEAEDLTDELLQTQWHLPALALMIERSVRENDRELALHAAALASDLGIPTLAIRAGDLADIWSQPAGQVIAFAAQGVVPHLPPSWLDEWTGLAHVSAALAVEVTGDDLAAETLTAAWARVVEDAGLAGYEVLSPAQRRIRGLVRRRRAASWRRRLLTVAGVVVVAAAVSVAMFLMFRTPPPDSTPTTAPAAAAVIPLEERELPRPDERISGQFMYQGDAGHSGYLPNVEGVTEAEGYYWRYPAAGRILGSPVTKGVHGYVATTDAVVAIDLTDTSVFWRFPAGAELRSTPAVAEIVQAGRGGQAPGQTVVAFGDAGGTIYFRDAGQAGGGLVHQVSTEGSIVGSPLVMGPQIVAVSSGSEGATLLAISPHEKRVDWVYGDEPNELLGEVRAAPSYADGIVYVATTGPQGRLHMIRADDGIHICETASLGSIDFHPVVTGGIVYVATSDGTVHARAAGDCNIRPLPDRNIIYTIGPRISGAPAVAGDLMVIPGGSQLITIDLTDLDQTALVWAFPSGADILSAPLIAGETVYVGNDAGVLYALALHANDPNGEELWHWDAGSAIRSPVAVLDGVVIVATVEGTVTAIGGS